MRTIITFITIILTAVACNDSTTVNNVNNTNNTNSTEVCNDNIDNDFDGDIDCNDFDCKFTTACTVGVCGNGAIESGEECDGGNFDGKSCQVFGYQSGQLSCNADCTIDIEGCESPDPLKIMQSGGRIKMRVGRAAAPDGSVSFNGWYDTQLGINCVWRKAVDGAMRCLPELTATRTRWYIGSTCSASTRLAAFPVDDAPVQNGEYVSQESGGVFYAYIITGVVTGMVYHNNDTTCRTWTVSDGAMAPAAWYTVQAVDALTFQAQYESIE